MRKLFLLCLAGVVLVLFSSNLNAQFADTVWTRTYGGESMDQGEWVEPVGRYANNGELGFIIVGQSMSWNTNRFNLYIVRTDLDGDTLWTRLYGGPGHDGGRCIKEISDGFIICGGTQPEYNGLGYLWLLKIDETGDTVWTSSCGNPYGATGFQVCPTSDGGYITLGYTRESNTYYSDIYLAKFSGDGDVIWTRTYGDEESSEIGHSIIQAEDDGYVITGGDHGVYYGPDLMLMKTNSAGDVLWHRTYGDTGYDGGYSAAQAPDGGYMVAGYKTIREGVNHHDMYIIKTDEDGLAEWERTYGGAGHDVAFSIRYTYDDEYIVCGLQNQTVRNGTDAYAMKINGLGDVLWDLTVSSDRDQSAVCVNQTLEGDYIMVGSKYFYPDNSWDYFLIRFYGMSTEITDIDNMPRNFGLAQNYPNPFNASTTFGYRLPAESEVTIEIYDVLGRKVTTLVDGMQQPGYHQIAWDAGDVSSGVYFYKLQAGIYKDMKKMLLLK